MTHSIKINGRFITVNGKRVKVDYSVGPWVAGVDPTLIKISPRTSSRFPREWLNAFVIENKSDMREDYFESDSVRMLPSHPLYAQVKAAALQA